MFKITVFGCLLIICTISLPAEKIVTAPDDDYARDKDDYRVAFLSRKDIRGYRNALGQLCFKGQEEAVLLKHQGKVLSHAIDLHGQCYVNGDPVTWFEYDLTASMVSQGRAYTILQDHKLKVLGLRVAGRLKA